ncbi:hypothetical protein E4O00_12985 [Treponema sp. OMZ 788]|uniref:hypothetical protein n=1 Tax=Treponema sp. OMZ 788 TaxID=2563664 RepID=UPI0020A4F42B|nr:hypothetical protein [Treponema sp. OMZ 788]UTC64642.1 hypothetical protein E4O00_12985 [Treponema sp. OMZ 788]
MKKIKIVFFMAVLTFIFTGCELLDSLARESEIIKQIKDEDLQGHTITWLIFADDSDALNSAAYKKASDYYKKVSESAGLKEQFQIIVVSDGIERAIRDKVKEAGFDADCFPLKWNGNIKNKYNPNDKKNYSVFFDKKGRALFSMTQEWKFENFEGLADYALELAGLSRIGELKNPLTFFKTLNKITEDDLFKFVNSALNLNLGNILRYFIN